MSKKKYQKIYKYRLGEGNKKVELKLDNSFDRKLFRTAFILGVKKEKGRRRKERRSSSSKKKKKKVKRDRVRGRGCRDTKGWPEEGRGCTRRGGRPEASRILHFYSTLSFFRPASGERTSARSTPSPPPPYISHSNRPNEPLAPSRWRWFPGQASCAVSLRKEYIKNVRGSFPSPPSLCLPLPLRACEERHTRGSTGVARAAAPSLI